MPSTQRTLVMDVQCRSLLVHTRVKRSTRFSREVRGRVVLRVILHARAISHYFSPNHARKQYIVNGRDLAKSCACIINTLACKPLQLRSAQLLVGFRIATAYNTIDN